MLKDLCFEVIQKCPNNCMFCSSRSSIDCENIISLDTFKRVIDHFLKLGGIEEISISGGEPFLHPDLFEMVKYCKNKGIRTIIYTSGTVKRRKFSDEEKSKLTFRELHMLNEIEKFDYNHLDRSLLRELKEIGLDKIVFDLQATDVDVYNYLMNQTNQFANVLASIIYAYFEGIESELHFIPLKANYKCFKEFVELAEEAGVKRISILKFVPQGRGKDNIQDLKLSDEEMNKFINDVKNINSKVEIRLGIPLTEKDTHLCTAGNNKFVIRYDGLVLPCPAFKEYDLDVLKQNGIKPYNIYTDLEKITVNENSREKPLCKLLRFPHS